MMFRVVVRITTALIAVAVPGVTPLAAQTLLRDFVPRVHLAATATLAYAEIQNDTSHSVSPGTLEPTTYTLVGRGQAAVVAHAGANTSTDRAVPQSSVGQPGGPSSYSDSRFARFTPQMMPGCVSAGSGGDDAACIQAAVSAAAQAYGASTGPNAGAVYFPYPSSGSYNICSAHIALPGGSSAIRLEGVAAGGSSIRIMPGCANPPTEVLYQPINTAAISQSRVTLDDLTIDGYGLAAHDINIQYAVGFTGHNVVLRNVAKAGSNLYIRGGYEIEFGSSNRIENVNDAGHIIYMTASDLPNYGLETYATDSNYSNLIIIDAYLSYVYQGNGGNNHFIATHGWGYASANSGTGQLQRDFRAQYAFQAKGNAQFLGAIADGYKIAGFFLQGLTGVDSGAVVAGSYWFGMPSGTCGVLLDTGLRQTTIVGNDMHYIPNSATHGVCSVNGAVDPSNIIRGNQGLATDSNFAVGPIGGDALSLVGYAAGRGGEIGVMSSNLNASLYLTAKGTAGVNIQSNSAVVAGFSAPISAVNRLAIIAAAKGTAPQVKAVGTDTNIDLQLIGQGSGGIAMGGPVKHTLAPGVAAAGTTQATATALSKDISVVSRVPPGSGVLLAPNIGQRQETFNRGANTLAVYPPSGAQIEKAGIDNAVYLAIGAHATFECVSNMQCYQGP